MKILPVLILLFAFVGSVVAQDWPDWRGTNRDAIWKSENIIEKFESDTIAIKWRVPINPGYSGPTVANGKVYLSDRIEKPVSQERVLCFDETSGKMLWEFTYDCEYSGIGYPAGPRASVVIHENRAYALGSMGNLFCFDAEKGSVIWEKNLNKAYEINMPIWGIASTPLIVKNKLIVHVSGNNNAGIVAFDKNTGNEIWRNLNDRAGYSAPILIEKNGKQVVVNWTEHSLSGLNPETGEVYWRFPWQTGSGMSIATPVLSDDHIFVSAFYSGSLLIKLGNDYTTAEKVWQREGESERKTDALHCVMNTPIILGKYIYGVDSYGELRCLDFNTGDRIWEDQTAVKRARWANIHFVQHQENIWMFNEQGELLITQLSPKGFNEISRAFLIAPTRKQLGRGVCWSHPAFANQHIFIRNDNELVCASLKK
ncbi:PQQ-binding-like beta-propeller repeat protein [uncultured Draconibacterium sp.]|uniref:PQQ-binding-like beta-propeller repeat protein n=1 Tax=uncultured Draconibacterium sp. TaxID=1573823 RepID=UPI00326007AD